FEKEPPTLRLYRRYGRVRCVNGLSIVQADSASKSTPPAMDACCVRADKVGRLRNPAPAKCPHPYPETPRGACGCRGRAKDRLEARERECGALRHYVCRSSGHTRRTTTCNRRAVRPCAG